MRAGCVVAGLTTFSKARSAGFWSGAAAGWRTRVGVTTWMRAAVLRPELAGLGLELFRHASPNLAKRSSSSSFCVHPQRRRAGSVRAPPIPTSSWSPLALPRAILGQGQSTEQPIVVAICSILAARIGAGRAPARDRHARSDTQRLIKRHFDPAARLGGGQAATSPCSMMAAPMWRRALEPAAHQRHVDPAQCRTLLAKEAPEDRAAKVPEGPCSGSDPAGMEMMNGPRNQQENSAVSRRAPIATSRSDRWPQATTVGYVNEGLTLYFLCGLHSQKATNLARDDRLSLTIDHDTPQIMEITGLSMAARAQAVTDRAEQRKFCQVATQVS